MRFPRGKSVEAKAGTYLEGLYSQICEQLELVSEFRDDTGLSSEDLAQADQLATDLRRMLSEVPPELRPHQPRTRSRVRNTEAMLVWRDVATNGALSLLRCSARIAGEQGGSVTVADMLRDVVNEPGFDRFPGLTGMTAANNARALEIIATCIVGWAGQQGPVILPAAAGFVVIAANDTKLVVVPKADLAGAEAAMRQVARQAKQL